VIGRDLLGIEDLDRSEIERLLDTADHMREIGEREVKKVPTLRGRTIINLFFEPSTRTRASFEIAGKRLSADVINFSPVVVEHEEGREHPRHRQTLEAMDADAVIVRHEVSGVPKRIAEVLEAPVINAGDGAHEHPTQALLDCFTVRQVKGKIDGLTVTIVGDILHSRVARSNILAFRKLGAEVRVAAPPPMIPPAIEETFGVKAYTSLREALEGADVVMALRIQNERLEGAFFPSVREYSATYGIDRAKLQYAKEDAIVMHPGPINRGVELSHDLADHKPSVILDQVRNGVALRMAVLYLFAGRAPRQRAGESSMTRILAPRRDGSRSGGGARRGRRSAARRRPRRGGRREAARRRRAGDRRDAAAGWRRASSTCTATCASRVRSTRRRSARAGARPRRAASPRSRAWPTRTR
jgi:aspartate carbamoyltransferase catalytic subunit